MAVIIPKQKIKVKARHNLHTCLIRKSRMEEKIFFFDNRKKKKSNVSILENKIGTVFTFE